MSRIACFAFAGVLVALALAGPTGCGGGSDDFGDLVSVYVRNSMPNTHLVDFEMIPAGSAEPRVNLLSGPVPYGETRFVTRVTPGYYDVSGSLEADGGGGVYAFIRVDEPVLQTDEAKVIDLTP